jgi:hypothetical protein
MRVREIEFASAAGRSLAPQNHKAGWGEGSPTDEVAVDVASNSGGCDHETNLAGGDAGT